MPADSVAVDPTMRSRCVVVDDYLSERLVGADSSLHDALVAGARAGEVTDADVPDDRVAGTWAALDLLHAEPRLDAAAPQTGDGQGRDGFALAGVTS